MLKFIYEWQTLIGAFLGAATPISLWFLTEWYKSHKDHGKHLYRLEKILVYNINTVRDTYETINHFIKTRLPSLIDNIEQATRHNIYSVDTAFFPLLATHPVDEKFLDVNTRSGYCDNKIVHVSKLSKDFAIAIDNMRNQFTHTIQLNKDMAFSKLNPPKIQNSLYRHNIEEFINVARRDLLEKNVKTYIRILVSARVAINTLRDFGIFRWRLKFEPHFKYFRNKQDLHKFTDENYKRIDNFLEERISNQLKEIEELLAENR